MGWLANWKQKRLLKKLRKTNLFMRVLELENKLAKVNKHLEDTAEFHNFFAVCVSDIISVKIKDKLEARGFFNETIRDAYKSAKEGKLSEPFPE